MGGYDVIGDVHGHADKLNGLLAAMGYQQNAAGVWAHVDRRVIFIGDLIDRGPGQVETLTIARGMVDAGSGQIVLGNHEFNALAWATYDASRDRFCRPHSDKNRSQHDAFLSSLDEGSSEHDDWLAWFRTIPLWLDLGDLRLVHACWSPAHMAVLEPLLTARRTLTDEVIRAGTTKGSAVYDAIEVILKGPEVELGDDRAYLDKGGHERRRARWSWWDPAASSLRSGAFIPRDARTRDGHPFPELPDDGIEGDLPPRYAESTPVIFGHYWWTGRPAVFSPTLACVDYSVARGGPLVAYRWDDGDNTLSSDRFVRYPG